MAWLQKAFVEAGGGDQDSAGGQPDGNVAVAGGDESFLIHKTADPDNFLA
jgi:hypothetical protein